MSDTPKKVVLYVCAGSLVAVPAGLNMKSECTGREQCELPRAEMPHVDQRDPGPWDPAPRYTLAVSSSTASTNIGPIFSIPRFR
jgi:hypothetical protein